MTTCEGCGVSFDDGDRAEWHRHIYTCGTRTMTSRRETIDVALSDALEALDVARNQLGLLVADGMREIGTAFGAQHDLEVLMGTILQIERLKRRVSDGQGETNP